VWCAWHGVKWTPGAWNSAFKHNAEGEKVSGTDGREEAGRNLWKTAIPFE
jgi:hypothetical protein